MDIEHAGPYLAGTHKGALVTLHADGRPQVSNIAYHYAGGVIRISVTAGRQKSRNLARDPRAAVHVSDGNWGQWVVAEGRAELSPVSTEAGDSVGRALLELYESITGSVHPDRADFLAAMVKDRRLLIRLPVAHVYGQLP